MFTTRSFCSLRLSLNHSVADNLGLSSNIREKFMENNKKFSPNWSEIAINSFSWKNSSVLLTPCNLIILEGINGRIRKRLLVGIPLNWVFQWQRLCFIHFYFSNTWQSTRHIIIINILELRPIMKYYSIATLTYC